VSHRRRLLCGVGLLLALAGCHRADDTQRPPLVAVVMKSLANGFFVTMAEGAAADQAKRPAAYRLVMNGTRNESDLAQQVAIVDAMIAMGAKAIVIAPTDSKAVVPALARARKAGIVVINIDNRLDRAVQHDYGVRIPFVGPDNREGARQVGAVAAQRLKPGDQVAILEGITTADNSRQRREGLEAAVREADLTLVSEQSAEWDQTKAADLSAALLVRYPKLRAILCANDSMALGAASAVAQSGRAGRVQVTGFDDLPAIRPLIRSGAVTASADQHAAELVVFGIDAALEALRAGTQAADRTTPVGLVVPATLARLP
jgi:ribose transport system substrate-binding protein